jgi:hypothetical protein
MIKNNNTFKVNRKLTKKPVLLNVIRKKNSIFTSWWDNTGINGDTYYTGMLNDRQYLYSFFNKDSTENCVSFIKRYKLINGKYPEHTSTNTQQIDQESEVYIDLEPIESIKSRCLLNNIGLIGITNFEYTFYESYLNKKNVFNVTMSGSDLLEQETINSNTQIDHLNDLLDF